MAHVPRSYNNILPDGTRVSSDFSRSRVHPQTKKARPHNGTDIAAPNGSPVYSPADGVVVQNTFNKGGYGNYIVIQHTRPNGTVVHTLYAHLNAPSSLNPHYS